MFCRLEALVNTIVADAGGEVSLSFQFTFKDEFCTLDWEYNLKPLTYRYGEMSNHMMEWVRTWLNPQLEDVKCYVCSPYLVSILTGFLDLHPTERIEAFIEFIHDKYPTLPELDITNLLVPFTCGQHWTLYVLGDHGFFHFDSMRDAQLHNDSTRCTRLAKLWAAQSGYDEASTMWRKAKSPSSWIKPTVPQQNSGWACGFYVLRNIREYTQWLRTKPIPCARSVAIPCIETPRISDEQYRLHKIGSLHICC